jgi:hypothetical protein
MEYMWFYNERGIHSSILDLPQHEFYKRAKTEAFMMKEVRVIRQEGFDLSCQEKMSNFKNNLKLR